MPVDLNIFKTYLLSFSRDSRISVWHLGVMFGIINMASGQDIREPIFISRSKIMKLAHIGSIVTYHKCIKELQEFGYIDYLPSYHPAVGSKVYLK
jgi:hypothetical protein